MRRLTADAWVLRASSAGAAAAAAEDGGGEEREEWRLSRAALAAPLIDCLSGLRGGKDAATTSLGEVVASASASTSSAATATVVVLLRHFS